MLALEHWLAVPVAALVTTVTIVVLKPMAGRLALVDRPDARKQHDGCVPLVGGLAIFAGMLAGLLLRPYALSVFTLCLFGTTAVLVMIGALDDRYGLSVRIRLCIQVTTVLVMIAVTGIHVESLGPLFGHELVLGWLGVPLTVIAVVGLVNAFNMMDGLDGLAGLLGLVSVCAIVLFDRGGRFHGFRGIDLLIVLMGVTLLPYLAFNLRLAGRRNRIFMGDAGSLLLGYIIAWRLVFSSQSDTSLMLPVDVLWCVALPVIDTLAVMVRRVSQGHSPFRPDRGHIHHAFLRAGFGPRDTLVALVCMAAGLAMLGRILEDYGTGASLTTFVCLTVAYAYASARVWKRQTSRPATPGPATASLPVGITAGMLPHPLRSGMRMPYAVRYRHHWHPHESIAAVYGDSIGGRPDLRFSASQSGTRFDPALPSRMPRVQH